MKHITKVYGSLYANDDVHLTLDKGEILAVVGENGAGKSTLMKILYGLEQPTSGEIYINGELQHFRSPHDAIAKKIGMVQQHFMLLEPCTVAENIVYGREPRKKGLFFDRETAVHITEELCEKYGFDCIDIQSECLNRDLEVGKITLEEMGAWFQSHHLKMLSYNALCFFNMKQTQEEKDAVMAELDEIIRRCNILGCKMIVVVPSKDMKERGLTPTRKEIREDAVAVLKEMVKKCEPHGIRLSLEFCGEPSMTINRFEDAYAIVEAVDSPYVGVTLDQYHFYAMGSGWDTLEKADGKKIFVWHLNGTEDMPCGAYYNNDEKRLWPGAEGDCLPHARYADTLKKIGFDGDCCTIEIFRPAYYEMSQEENVKKSAEVTRAHVAKYAQF